MAMGKNHILLLENTSQRDDWVRATIVASGYSIERTHSISDKLHPLVDGRYQLVIFNNPNQSIDLNASIANIKQQSPDTPVVVLTSQPSVTAAVSAMHHGASDYLAMPSQSDLITSLLEKYIPNGSQKERDDHSGVNEEQSEKDFIGPFITQDKTIEELLSLVKTVGPGNATVLIQGESGTGKEILAGTIHHYSGRKKMIALNCAALPESLAESELFGAEKGAFTGAVRRRVGKFEQAHKGTLLLDEIGEMPVNLQAKLLRAIQQRQIDRIGGDRPVQIDTRIIATTNVDLEKAVDEGTFREDLYYRLSVIPLHIPPLRERRGDIPVLVSHFIKKFCRMNGQSIKKVGESTLQLLARQEWKGNVRELENAIERAVLLSPGDNILPEHLFITSKPSTPKNSLRLEPGMTVRAMEKELIHGTLQKVNDNRTKAAAMLGISIRTLRNKLNQYQNDK